MKYHIGEKVFLNQYFSRKIQIPALPKKAAFGYALVNFRKKGGQWMNHVGLVGRTTKDLELRHLSEGRVRAYFSIAANRSFKNSEGKVDADFVQCVAWGRNAELMAKYCGKGSLVGIKGRLQSRTYVNRENQKVYTMEVQTEEVQFYALKAPGEAGKLQTMPPIAEDFVLPEQEIKLVHQP